MAGKKQTRYEVDEISKEKYNVVDTGEDGEGSTIVATSGSEEGAQEVADSMNAQLDTPKDPVDKEDIDKAKDELPEAAIEGTLANQKSKGAEPQTQKTESLKAKDPAK